MIPTLAWAGMVMAHEDRKAEAEAEWARDERLARNEDLADLEATRDALSVARHGYSQRQLRQWQAEREAERQDRIAELQAELGRLDAPSRLALARSEQLWADDEGTELAHQAVWAERYQAQDRAITMGPAAMDSCLRQARAHASDEFMARQVQQLHRRELARQAAHHEAEANRLGRQVRQVARRVESGVGWPGEISRAG